jgi:kinesin family member 26
MVSNLFCNFHQAKGKSGGSGGKSDEQWIDGPRISRSKVAEARSLLKESHKRETWVDGPQAGSGPAPAAVVVAATAPSTAQGTVPVAAIPGAMPAAQGYGYMDNHKKCMIQRWVENQTVQIQQKLMKQGQPEYKEMTQFKTCEDSETSPEAETAPEVPPAQPPPQQETPEEPKEQVRLPPPPQEVVEEEEDDEDCVSELPPPLPLLHQHNNKDINKGESAYLKHFV